MIANTGDDVEVYGVHVSPDPDLVTYWLADAIDERGYGIRGDTLEVMDALAAAGRPTWFRLGDRDLAMCLIRTELLQGGQAADGGARRGGGGDGRAGARAADVRRAGGHLGALGGTPGCPFQEFMIVERRRRARGGRGAARDSRRARPTEAVLGAIAEADAIVIGPSNPVISIGPILAVPGMRDALAAARAPVVAVSPFVGGHAVKGPTESFCAQAGIEASAAGIVAPTAGCWTGSWPTRR